MTTCQNICEVMNKLHPNINAESWDNVGLLLGSTSSQISKIMVALDITDKVVREAINDGIDMIIIHHPIIHNPLNRITDETSKGARLLALAAANVAVYAAHTNLDAAEDGTSAALAQLLALSNVRPFAETENGGLYFGRYGDIPPVTLADFAAQTAQLPGSPAVRYYGDGARIVRKAAILAGSGMGYCAEAAKTGADVFITGDVKYHAAQEALDLGLCVVDVTHDGGERPVLPLLARRLETACNGAVAVFICEDGLLAKAV